MKKLLLQQYLLLTLDITESKSPSVSTEKNTKKFHILGNFCVPCQTKHKNLIFSLTSTVKKNLYSYDKQTYNTPNIAMNVNFGF